MALSIGSTPLILIAYESRPVPDLSYGGDSSYRTHGHEIIRLLFADRRPISITQTSRRNQASSIVDSINAFLTEHQ